MKRDDVLIGVPDVLPAADMTRGGGIWTSLCSHAFLLVFLILLGTAGGFARGMIELNSYTAEAQLLLRPGLRELTSPESVLSNSRSVGTAVPREVIANEVQILSDPALYRRVAIDLGPAFILERPDPTRFDNENTPLWTRWLHQAQYWWMHRGEEQRNEAEVHAVDDCDRCVEMATLVASRSTTVTSLVSTTMLQIQVKASSPRQAKQIADSVQRAAIAHHMETFSGSASRQFLEGKVEAAAKRLEETERSLFTTRAETGIFNLVGQLGDCLSAIQAAESRIAGTAITRAQLESKLELLESIMEGEEPMIETTVVQASLANPEVTYLRQQLYNLYSRRLDFAGIPGETLTEREARLQALEASITEMKAKLEAEPLFLEPVETVQVTPNARYASIRARMDAAREELAGLMAGSALEIKERDKLLAELARLTKYEPRIRELERQSLALRRELDQLEQTSERFAMINELDQGNLSNLVPLRAAALPMTKSGPNRTKFLLLGVLLGLCSGLGIIFLLDANQPRVVSPGDAQHVFDDESLALETVPPSGLRKRQGKEESASTDWT